MTRIAAVIFDCDGTLVDSEPLARIAWERSLAPYGYAIDDAEYAGLIGLPYPRVHGFFAERIPGLAAPDAFWAAYSGALFALIDTTLEPFADALETVRGRCARAAWRSPSRRPRRAPGSTARSPAPGSTARSPSRSPATRSRTASRRPTCSSPRPSGSGSRPARCAVIEDSGPGVAAGLAAGMRTVGVARAGHDAAALRRRARRRRAAQRARRSLAAAA